MKTEIKHIRTDIAVIALNKRQFDDFIGEVWSAHSSVTFHYAGKPRDIMGRDLYGFIEIGNAYERPDIDDMRELLIRRVHNTLVTI